MTYCYMFYKRFKKIITTYGLKIKLLKYLVILLINYSYLF